MTEADDRIACLATGARLMDRLSPLVDEMIDEAARLNEYGGEIDHHDSDRWLYTLRRIGEGIDQARSKCGLSGTDLTHEVHEIAEMVRLLPTDSEEELQKYEEGRDEPPVEQVRDLLTELRDHLVARLPKTDSG